MNRHFPGLLISIEGIDGTGKTTQAHLLQEYLEARKIPVVRTREPTAGRWGQLLRDSAITGRLSLEQEIEAFIKDRQEHVEGLIKPSLKKGEIVITDRYYFSNMAYQGARGHDPQDILKRNEEFAPEPDLLVILDLDPNLALNRIETRGDRANYFEQTENLRKAREIYLGIKKPYAYVLDANQSVGLVCDQIVRKFSTIASDLIRSEH